MLRATWQLSAVVAAVLLGGYAVLSLAGGQRWSRLRAFCLQFGVVVAIFAVYQHTAHYAHSLTAGADARARWVWHAEQWLHLPSEVWVQSLFLPFPDVVRFFNWYYAALHLTSMTVFLVWMWWRHRDHYVLACVTVAATTLICVAWQHVPVAPPRLTPGLGFVDTGVAYGLSMYGPGGHGIAAQLAAMPSIHVAWAGIIAFFAVRLSASPWRWLLVAHLVMTTVVVVATANHWWLDGVAGLGVAGLVYAAAARVLGTPRRQLDPISLAG